MNMDFFTLSFVIIFMLHNLEEIITIEKWFQKSYPHLQNRMPSFVQKQLKQYESTTSAQFAAIIFVFSVFVSALILASVITQYNSLFLGVNLFFALNIFTHPLQSLYLRSYTPGVLTSLILLIPYYCLFFYYNYQTDMFSFATIIEALIVMTFLIPVFIVSHKIGGKRRYNK